MNFLTPLSPLQVLGQIRRISGSPTWTWTVSSMRKIHRNIEDKSWFLLENNNTRLCHLVAWTRFRPCSDGVAMWYEVMATSTFHLYSGTRDSWSWQCHTWPYCSEIMKYDFKRMWRFGWWNSAGSSLAIEDFFLPWFLWIPMSFIRLRGWARFGFELLSKFSQACPNTSFEAQRFCIGYSGCFELHFCAWMVDINRCTYADPCSEIPGKASYL